MTTIRPVPLLGLFMTVFAFAVKAEPSDSSRHPSAAIPVRATAMGLIPGAIICPDLQTSKLMGHLYSEYAKDAMADAITHGQMKLYRPSTPEPDLSVFNCVMVEPGTPMIFHPGQFAPVVTAVWPDGTSVRGVTQWGMFDGPGLHH